MRLRVGCVTLAGILTIVYEAEEAAHVTKSLFWCRSVLHRFHGKRATLVAIDETAARLTVSFCKYPVSYTHLTLPTTAEV